MSNQPALSSDLRLLSLTVENIKRIRAVEITPSGSVIEITGPNGAGKSSVIDSIWWLVAGAKHIQTVPIRKGQDKAFIRGVLGKNRPELVVERKFVNGKPSSLTVESADGARFPSPQTLLDALIGALAFDPEEFARMEPREQFEALRAIVPLDVDLDQLDGLNARDRERRTEINRDAKSRRAQADGIVAPADLPEAAVDTAAALLDRIGNAAKVNADIETRKGRREQARTQAAAARETATSLRTVAEEFRRQATEKDEAANKADRMADEIEEKLRNAEPLPTAVDVDAIRAELAKAEETNRHRERWIQKSELLAQAEAREREAQALTEAITAREKAKADAIAAAPMPVEGLGFGDGVVTFNGVPFDQASSAEQLRVSVGIAMAANPKLKVICIKNGSLLDTNSLAMITGMAAERGYTVWIERVDTSGKVGVVIEDGAVAAVNAPAGA